MILCAPFKKCASLYLKDIKNYINYKRRYLVALVSMPNLRDSASAGANSSDSNVKPSEWIRKKRTVASVREAAREIQDQLNRWHADKETAKMKWVWELIQNARDVAKKQNKKSLHVRFTLLEDELIFEHDAGPFSLDDIYALVNGRSSKPLESSDIIGQFGKGFIVTHIVSGKVKVKGWLRGSDEFKIDRTFEMTLDRNIQSTEELTVKHIAENIEECSRQLDKIGPQIEHDISMFAYPLDQEGRDAAVNGLETLKQASPFLLAFAEPRMTLKITQESQEAIYELSGTELIQSQPVKIELLKMAQANPSFGDSLITVVSTDSNVKMAVPYNSRDHSILAIGKVPQLFKMYPLAKTEDLMLPAIIDAPFRVSGERFDLQYRDDQIKELRDTLHAAMRLLYELCRWSLENNILRKELLFKIRSPEKERPYQTEWIRALTGLVEDVKRLNMVEVMVGADTEEREFAKIDSVYFPSPKVGLDEFEDEEFGKGIWWLSRCLGLKVPSSSLIDEWNEIRECWKSLGISAGNEQTFEKLVRQTQSLKNLDILKQKTGSDKKTLDFLKNLYRLGNYYRCQRAQIPTFLMMAIYCNQDGDFESPEDLYIDHKVPENLKKIAEDLSEPLSKRLLNTEFSEEAELKNHFQALGLNTIDESKSIIFLYDSIHRNWKQKGGFPDVTQSKYKKAVMEFEKWLLQEERTYRQLEQKYPLRELPFLCEDNALRVAEREYLVLPDSFLSKEAKEHTKIWPQETKLSAGYSEAIADTGSVRKRLVEIGISQPDLIFTEVTDLSTDEIKKLSNVQIRGDFTARAEISRIVAFDKVLRFAEQSRHPDLTKSILLFLLGYAVPNDNSWQETKQIRALEVSPNAYGKLVPTGKEREFKLYPSMWLAQVKCNSWAVITSEDEKGRKSFEVEQPSKNALVSYLKMFPPGILSDEKVQMFLQREFEFSPIEIAGWLLTGGKTESEQALVKSLKQIHEMAESHGIDPIEFLNGLVLDKQIGDQFDRRNANFGLVIEKAVRKVFEKQLKHGEYDFEVIPNWKGYDFRAYLGRNIEESDYGILSLSFQQIRSRKILAQFEVEVKSTKTNAVTMTLPQANSAVDHSEIYLLCVVESKDLSEDHARLETTAIGEDEVERLSEKLLPYINIVSVGEDLRQAIVNFRKASSVTSEIRVNYDARFTIPSSFWKTKGRSINDWFVSVLKHLGVTA
jgi:hypothetical protein